MFVDFFFMNFINNNVLRLFKKYRKVMDVFFLRKVRKECNYRFVFVRFEGNEEVEKVIRREDVVKLD